MFEVIVEGTPISKAQAEVFCDMFRIRGVVPRTPYLYSKVEGSGVFLAQMLAEANPSLAKNTPMINDFIYWVKRSANRKESARAYLDLIEKEWKTNYGFEIIEQTGFLKTDGFAKVAKGFPFEIMVPTGFDCWSDLTFVIEAGINGALDLETLPEGNEVVIRETKGAVWGFGRHHGIACLMPMQYIEEETFFRLDRTGKVI